MGKTSIRLTDETVYRSRRSGAYAVRIEPSVNGVSYWGIVGAPGGGGGCSGWSYYADAEFEPAPEMSYWCGKEGGHMVEFVLPRGEAPS